MAKPGMIFPSMVYPHDIAMASPDMETCPEGAM